MKAKNTPDIKFNFTKIGKHVKKHYRNIMQTK